MINYKCDECNVDMDAKRDAYYTLQTIEFHIPESGSYSSGKVTQFNPDVIPDDESYMKYLDLHFCVDCWNKIPLRDYVRRWENER